MASYQSRRRDPLLDSTTQAAIEKRTKELLGLGLILVGLLIAVMVGSYSPNDPSWISATDAPVQNWLGHFGASAAAPLMMVIGLGVWVMPLALVMWGVRFVMHHGQERAIGRLVFVPVAIILASVHAATLTPGTDWPANFGLGGLFGDTVLGVILTIAPVGAIFGVKLLSFLTGVALLALIAFILGFTRPEMKAAGRFVLLGTVMLYAMLLRVLGKGASLSAQAAQGMSATMQARRQQIHEARAARAEEPALRDPFSVPPLQDDARTRAAAVVRANPVVPTKEPPLTAPKMPPAPPLAAPARTPAPEPQGGGFLSGLLKRNEAMPEPELVTPEPVDHTSPTAGDTDRVSARIADAIKSRSVPPSPTGVRIEPSLTAGRGPLPLVFEPLDEDAFADESLVEDMEDAPRMAEPHMPIPKVHVPTPPVMAPPPESRSVVQHPPKRAQQPSRQAKAEAQPALKFDVKYASYEHPPLGLLTNPIEIQRHHLSDEALEENARML
ncbi:DNA translocase FtsK 4TM domain-containing protein, partial [Yoonia sp.]|uniref:DNA translocase FtsK 4TM domain-containing protein n=1 Tax=Yoonia sp. TaxID=2212373 RepID=UPI003975F3C8